MGKTTIELTDEQKQMLRDARLPHESNYGETVERLCGNSETPYMTEEQVREIANEQIAERVVTEAQQ